MSDWELKHSVVTRANRTIVWGFMTDMNNQVRMEPAIERIELDGAFTSGTKGRTINKDGSSQD